MQDIQSTLAPNKTLAALCNVVSLMDAMLDVWLPLPPAPRHALATTGTPSVSPDLTHASSSTQPVSGCAAQGDAVPDKGSICTAIAATAGTDPSSNTSTQHQNSRPDKLSISLASTGQDITGDSSTIKRLWPEHGNLRHPDAETWYTIEDVACRVLVMLEWLTCSSSRPWFEEHLMSDLKVDVAILLLKLLSRHMSDAQLDFHRIMAFGLLPVTSLDEPEDDEVAELVSGFLRRLASEPALFQEDPLCLPGMQQRLDVGIPSLWSNICKPCQLSCCTICNSLVFGCHINGSSCSCNFCTELLFILNVHQVLVLCNVVGASVITCKIMFGVHRCAST